MDNIDEQTFRRMIDEINGLSGSMSSMSKAMRKSGSQWENFQKDKKNRDKEDADSRKQAKKNRDWDENAFHNQLDRGAQKVAGSLSILKGGAEGLQSAFKSMSTKILGPAIGGVLIGGLTDYISGMVGTYRQLTDVGQGLTGGIIGMTKAAAESGVTLDEYARVMQKHSVTAKSLGTGAGSLGMMAKAVRKSTEDFGMFGYTIEQMNDMTADYVQSFIAFTGNEELNREKSQRSISNLAKNTNDLAATFGRSRQEIDKQTKSIMQSTLITASMVQSGGKGFDTLSMAVSGITAQLGEKGKELGQMLTDTRAMGGNAQLTSGAVSLGNGGVSEITHYMAELDKTLKAIPDTDPEKAGKVFDAQQKFMEDSFKLIKSRDTDMALRAQARSGNQDAAKVLDMLAEYERTKIKGINEEDRLKNIQKARDRFTAKDKVDKVEKDFTASVLSFTNQFNEIAGDIKVPMLTALGAGLEGLTKIMESDGFKKTLKVFIKGLVALSEAVGGFVTRLFGGPGAKSTEEAFSNFSDSLNAWVDKVTTLFNNSSSLGELIGSFFKDAIIGGMKFVFSAVITGLGSAMLDGVKSIFTMFTSPTKALTDVVIGLTAAFVAYKAVMMGKGVWDTLTGKGGASKVGTMTVHAGIVNVNGKGGMGLPDPHGGNQHGPRGGAGGAGGGRWGRLKGLAMGGIRGGARGIPLLGTALGAAFMAGDLGEIAKEKKAGTITEEQAADKSTSVVGKTIGAGVVSSLGGALGLLGGPLAPLTVPLGMALGGIVGGMIGDFGADKVNDARKEREKKQKEIDAEKAKIKPAEPAAPVTDAEKAKVKPPEPTVSPTAADATERLNRNSGTTTTPTPGAGATTVATPSAQNRISIQEQELRKQEAALEQQTRTENNVISMQLITEIKKLQDAVKQQTDILAKQNKEQLDVAKEQRNKLANLDSSS